MHAVLSKRIIDCRLNCNKSHLPDTTFSSVASPLKRHHSTTLVRSFTHGSLYSFVNPESEVSGKKAWQYSSIFLCFWVPSGSNDFLRCLFWLCITLKTFHWQQKTGRWIHLEGCSAQYTGTREMTKRGHSLQSLESTSLPSPTPFWRKSRPHKCYVAD